MAGGDDPSNGGRVTTRELYDVVIKQKDELSAALIYQNRERAEMERRILAKIDYIPSLVTQVDTNKDEIDKLRTRYNFWNSLNSLGVMVGTAFSALWKNGG